MMQRKKCERRKETHWIRIFSRLDLSPMPTANFKSFAPTHLTEDAQESGFLHCQQCGLVWFGRTDITHCPEGRHGKPVHVAVICRSCDLPVPIEHFAEHLADLAHKENASRGYTRGG